MQLTIDNISVIAAIKARELQTIEDKKGPGWAIRYCRAQIENDYFSTLTPHGELWEEVLNILQTEQAEVAA